MEQDYLTIISKYNKKFNTAVIAGAESGEYALSFANKFEKVLAFEFDLLKEPQLARNSKEYSNIKRFPYAIYNTEKFLTFDLLDDQNVIQPCNVKTVTIDSFINSYEIDCIMINVKYDQKFMILGAMDTIRYKSPSLIIKLSNDNLINEELGEFCTEVLNYRVVHQNQNHILYEHCSKI